MFFYRVESLKIVHEKWVVGRRDREEFHDKIGHFMNFNWHFSQFLK